MSMSILSSLKHEALPSALRPDETRIANFIERLYLSILTLIFRFRLFWPRKSEVKLAVCLSDIKTLIKH